MVRLREKRTALLLYAVLLVLPTLVLGGLQWRQLLRDQRDELADIPALASDAASRLARGVRMRLDTLLASENARPFYHYSERYLAEDALGNVLVVLHTPLLKELPPLGLLAWFNFEPFYARTGLEADEDPGLDLFFGPAPPDAESGLSEGALWRIAAEYMERSLAEGFLVRATRMGPLGQPVNYPLALLAVNRGEREDLDCLEDRLAEIEQFELPVRLSSFRLQLYNDDAGVPRIVASRRAFCLDELPPLSDSASCISEPLKLGFGLVQGFFLDPRWLFVDMPREVAAQALTGSEQLVLPAEAGTLPASVATTVQLDLALELGLSVAEGEPHDYARIGIAFDQAPLLARHRSQTLRFAAVGVMLLLSLGTGMVLLLRAVTREMEHAEQTENFVASVTHELRTPLSAIRLHGEMLLEGWVSDPERREEYYRRILRETDRLSTLVERVLEQARISRKAVEPEPGDLNAIVERMGGDLTRLSLDPALDGGQGPGDLALELTDDLPPVLLSREAVTGILVNLVENARKYAPVDTSRPDCEPIQITTRLQAGRVVLEVADRGPGILPEERARVFDAFYRVGNEATRTSSGTGLGLHLVHLHAAGLGARVEILDHEGGGALFRVTFRSA